MIIRGERLGRKEKDFWETSRDKNSSNIPVSWPRQWRPRVAYPRNYIVVGESYRNARGGSSVLKVSSLDSSGREKNKRKKKRRKNKKRYKIREQMYEWVKILHGKKTFIAVNNNSTASALIPSFHTISRNWIFLARKERHEFNRTVL